MYIDTADKKRKGDQIDELRPSACPADNLYNENIGKESNCNNRAYHI